MQMHTAALASSIREAAVRNSRQVCTVTSARQCWQAVTPARGSQCAQLLRFSPPVRGGLDTPAPLQKRGYSTTEVALAPESELSAAPSAEQAKKQLSAFEETLIEVLTKENEDKKKGEKEGVKKALEQAFENLGKKTYSKLQPKDKEGRDEKSQWETDAAGEHNGWNHILQVLVKRGTRDKVTSVSEFVDIVRFVAETVDLELDTFWNSLTRCYCWDQDSIERGYLRARQVSKMLMGANIDQLMDLTRLYSENRLWTDACEIVYLHTYRAVMTKSLIHHMDVKSLCILIDGFSRAGSFNQAVYGQFCRFIDETQDRVLEDIHDFDTDDLVSIVESMARIRVNRPALLQHMGGAKLHKDFLKLPIKQIVAVCHSYGELGWRHDTVFKEVVLDVIQENVRVQEEQALGSTDTAQSKYAIGDIAMVAQALLLLKMHRGNTTWCKWYDNYEYILDILTRQLENEVQNLSAKPLAAAAFVLGRARRGTLEMCKAMLTRMMNILKEKKNLRRSDDPPQYELARLMHGIAMMHPARKEDLETYPLMYWMMENYSEMPFSDVLSINRHLVQMGCYDHGYLKEFEPVLCDEVPNFKKDDIINITNTYNGAGWRDDDFERGRHLFWALGRRMQSLRIDEQAGRRPRYQRHG